MRARCRRRAARAIAGSYTSMPSRVVRTVHPERRRPATSGSRLSSAPRTLERLLHHGYTLMVQGESYRLKQKRKTGLLGTAEKSN